MGLKSRSSGARHPDVRANLISARNKMSNDNALSRDVRLMRNGVSAELKSAMSFIRQLAQRRRQLVSLRVGKVAISDQQSHHLRPEAGNGHAHF